MFKKFYDFIFSFLPLFKFKIEGNSMNPAFLDGDMVLINRLSYFFKKPRAGDVVIVKQGRCIIKRIAKIKDNKFFVVGDNKRESTDNRSFGWVNKEEIIGKAIYKIPNY